MFFEQTTLGEVSKGGKGNYGIAASAVGYSDELYTYLRITDIKDDGTIDFGGLKSVNDEKAANYLLQPNDIVFARTGASTGRNYFYDGSDGQFVYAGFLIKFSIDPDKVNPKYVKYYCLSQEYKGWIASYNTGSTRGNINAQTLAQMPLLLPERMQQDKMVDILSSIERKIIENEKINNNLPPDLLQRCLSRTVCRHRISRKSGNSLLTVCMYSKEKVVISALNISEATFQAAKYA